MIVKPEELPDDLRDAQPATQARDTVVTARA